MASAAAEQKRKEREREALGLVECRPCWPLGEAFEIFASLTLMSDDHADDREARGRFVALLAEAVADKLSRGDNLSTALSVFSRLSSATSASPNSSSALSSWSARPTPRSPASRAGQRERPLP
jgi:hypothetical protein